MTARCEACNAPVAWVRTVPGLTIAVDARPGHGNLQPNGARARVGEGITIPVVRLVPEGRGAYRRHRETCQTPHPRRWSDAPPRVRPSRAKAPT